MTAEHALPSLTELLDRLRSIAETGDELDADVPLSELPLDSLELLEWLFSVSEDLGYDLEFDDEVARRFFDLSLRELYDLLSSSVADASDRVADQER